MTVNLANETQVEPVTIDRLVLQIWTDSNGNGSHDPEREVFQVPDLAGPPFESTDCTTGQEIPAGEVYGCTIELAVRGNPWADPVVAMTATVSDDDDNEVKVDSVVAVDIEDRFRRGIDLRDEDLNVLALPSLPPSTPLLGWSPRKGQSPVCRSRCA